MIHPHDCPECPPPASAGGLRFTAIVANWEGEAWIERAVSSMLLAIRRAGMPGELLVVDDASTDDGPELVRGRFPQVRLLRNARNVGFGASVNRAVRAARGELVVLLNNDLVVREDFFAQLLAPFDGKGGRNLFATACRTLNWDGTAPNHLCMAAHWRDGRLQPAWSDPAGPTACLFAQGGAMACRRQVFLDLGGFDPIFHPGYWEDYDLCWQAASAGYQILYEPAAIAFHVGGGSMRKRYGDQGVFRMRAANHLVFEWLNLPAGPLLAGHAAWIPRHLWREWTAARGFGYTRALMHAASRLPSIVRGRYRRARRRMLAPHARPPSPREILQLARGFTPAPSP